MTHKRYIFPVIILSFLAGTVSALSTRAAPGKVTALGAPTMVAYQGQVTVGGSPYSGSGYFKFAIVDAGGTTTFWSNDGTSAGGGEPTTEVTLTVSDGLFSVLLGDTSLSGMGESLKASVFSESDRYLRVWFSTSSGGPFSQLAPDTRIASVPYALQAQNAVDSDTVDGKHASAFASAAHNHAPGDISPQGTGSGLDSDTVDGLHASDLMSDYQNVVVVAKSGGDYTSVQAAIDSITDASADNPYLVWVAPGVYSETVTMKSYVHLLGAGQEATVITSTVSNSVWPATQATLELASDTSLRDLTVGNGGVGTYNMALLARDGVTRTWVADVTARSQGSGIYNFAIGLTGSGTGVTLLQVTALGEGGSDGNYGLYNTNGSAAVLRGGSFTGRGGMFATGIYNIGSGTTLNAEGVTALGENDSSGSFGLANCDNAAAVLRGGSFTGRGGTDAYGIKNISSAMLDTERVTALGENGSSGSYGLHNYAGATADLRGGSFTGSGGTEAYGIYNESIDTTLVTESVTAVGENASGSNSGLHNVVDAAAVLHGGSFTGSGGTYSRGIYNDGSSTTLETENAIALGEDGVTSSCGLFNDTGATAVLRGGSFTARAGNYARGIYNAGSGTTLEAENIIVLSEDGSVYNYGLSNSATATLTQSVLEGTTYSVIHVSGTVTVSNSRLVGGAVSGTVTCVAVSRGTTFSANTCP